jgi:hypothetical protein
LNTDINTNYNYFERMWGMELRMWQDHVRELNNNVLQQETNEIEIENHEMAVGRLLFRKVEASIRTMC